MLSYNYTTGRDYTRSRLQTETPFGQQLYILVIDDDRDFTNTVCSLFNRLGYKASAAYDQVSGLKMVSEMRPDLIFCDIGLHNAGSYEIVNKIKTDESLKHAILVALTGYSHERTKATDMEWGFDFYISKPIRTSILQDIIKKVQTRKASLNRKKANALIY